MTERKEATSLSDDELAKVTGGATRDGDGSRRSDQDKTVKGGADGSDAAGGGSNLIAEGTPEDPIIFT